MLQLIGDVVKELWVSKGEEVLKFVMADGTNHYYKTDADCCSETWFADIVGVKALLGGKVTKATSMGGEVIKLERNIVGVERSYTSIHGEQESWITDPLIPEQPDQDDRCRQDDDKFYGIKLEIEGRGLVDIIYRNSSNGYYGGSCYYAGSYIEDNETTFVQITDDWSA